MRDGFLRAKIASIEEEVRVLRARVSNLASAKPKRKKFSELEGLWKGKADFSFDDIRDAEIKLKERRR